MTVRSYKLHGRGQLQRRQADSDKPHNNDDKLPLPGRACTTRQEKRSHAGITCDVEETEERQKDGDVQCAALWLRRLWRQIRSKLLKYGRIQYRYPHTLY